MAIRLAHRGDHRPRSDVDLAIEAPHADRRTWIALAMRQTKRRRCFASILCASMKLLQSWPTASAEGVVLYER